MSRCQGICSAQKYHRNLHRSTVNQIAPYPWHQAFMISDCISAVGGDVAGEKDEQDAAERYDPFAEEEEDEEVTSIRI